MKENEISEELHEQFLEAKMQKERANERYDALRQKIISLAGNFEQTTLLQVAGYNVLKIHKYNRYVFYPSRLRKDDPKLYKQYAEQKEYCTVSEIKPRKKREENTVV